MLKRTTTYIRLLVLMLVVASAIGCKATKRVPKGKQLLIKNEIYVNNKKVNDPTARAVIKQKPNRKIGLDAINLVIWRPYLQLYNLGNPNKEKGFGHWLTEIGEPPSVLDSTLMYKSARQLGQYYFNKGLFLNAVEAQVQFKRDSSRAIVRYSIYSGPQYYFGNVEYIISSPGIIGIAQQARAKSLIQNGMPYNAATLEEERSRLVTLLRNNGYYGFPKTLVRFEADTSAGNHTVDIRLIVSDRPMAVGDSVYYVEHRPFTIRNIYVNPNYNFSDPPQSSSDTIDFQGLKMMQDDPPNYKPKFIESSVHFKGGEVYNESKAKESYRHLTGNGVFQIAEITYKPVQGDTNNRLDAFIKMQPFLKRTFSAELEGTNTAGNYGISGSLTWANRNIFKGGEILDLSISGGFEAQVNLDTDELFNTREAGIEVGINFPRFFLFKGLSNRLPKRMEPKSRLFTSYNYQTRIEFERSILSLGLLYTWKESQTTKHQINLLDINYVRLPRIEDDYLNSLEFKTGFQDNLIMAIRYTYLYSNVSLVQSARTANYFRSSIEPAGNLLSAFNGTGNFELDEETQQYQVLGVPYAQYIKLDADFRHYINPNAEHQFITRIYAGTTINYGNSPFLPPFEKSFLAGGSNDMRGWLAYRLGPGNFPKHLYNQGNTSYAAVAPIKLLMSAEYRFPIIKKFRGALFFDAGNIWLWDRNYNTENLGAVEQALIDYGIFRFDTFYKQIALNTGIGWRYDFGFFALRLDMGIKIWDPTEPVNQRFVLGGLKWNTINYNIALGYPF